MSSKNLLWLVVPLITFWIQAVCLHAQPPTTEDDEVIKIDVALVNIPVVVSDKQGRRISGLNLQDFTLFEDGQERKIEYLSTEDKPLHIVLLLDTSRSAKEIIDKIKTAASRFIQQLNPSDRCMIITFDSQAQVATEFSANKTRLDRAIQRIEMSETPGTLMRDTLFVTVDKELRRVRGRKAVIMITDGKDAGSSISKNALLARLVESDAPIYSIFYETYNFLPPIPKQNKNGKVQTVEISQKQMDKSKADQLKKNQEAAEFLQKISDITSGRIFPKELDKLDEAIKSVSDELRKQYLISFYPDEANYNISKHQIKVKVNRPNVVVRTKNVNLVKR